MQTAPIKTSQNRHPPDPSAKSPNSSNPPGAQISRFARLIAHWRLDHEKVAPWPFEKQIASDLPFSWRVEDKMRLTKDKTALPVNPFNLANFSEIGHHIPNSATPKRPKFHPSAFILHPSLHPPEAFQYRLGNRSALDWVIDQYQVKEDPHTGVRSAPNQQDDPEYIVRLVGQVVRVSMETVRIVEELPGEIKS